MEQRTSEWYEKRRGRITASNFRALLAGTETESYQGLLYELAAQLKGAPDFSEDEPEKPWFSHGRKHEDEAIRFYEYYSGNDDVERVGFIVHPQIDYIGASPDGLVGADGGIEVKVNRSLKQFLKVKTSQRVPAQYRAQVQGNLLVTGRKWWDFVSYYRPEKGRAMMAIVRVYPEEGVCNRIVAAAAAMMKAAKAINQEEENEQ